MCEGRVGVITVKMATHEKGAREGARGVGIEGREGGVFFLSYLFPSSDFQIFKTIQNSKINTLLKDRIKAVADVPLTPFTKSSTMPQDLNKRSLELFETLRELDISTESVNYVPKEHRDADDDTIYCKNLFLKDRKGRFYLVLCEEDELVDLKYLKQKLKAYRNFSFASATELLWILGVFTGEVTPFALSKDTNGKVRVAATSAICVKEKLLNFHPLDKRYATRMTFADLQRFLTNCGHTLEILTP